MQLGVCAVYACVLWAVRLNPIRILGLQQPATQELPKVTLGDLVRTVPVGACSAAAHASSVFALGGDPVFGQIVKAGEPVLAAAVGCACYGQRISKPKAALLLIIVGGVAFASLKKGVGAERYELRFDRAALAFGMLANAFAAVKGAENKRLLELPGVAARFGGVGNQFAATEVIAFAASVPVMMATEGAQWGRFVELVKASRDLRFNLIASGLAFYLYNEVKHRCALPGATSAADLYVTFLQASDPAVKIVFLFLYCVCVVCHACAVSARVSWQQ